LAEVDRRILEAGCGGAGVLGGRGGGGAGGSGACWQQGGALIRDADAVDLQALAAATNRGTRARLAARPREAVATFVHALHQRVLYGRLARAESACIAVSARPRTPRGATAANQSRPSADLAARRKYPTAVGQFRIPSPAS
jgi:hypothetical protein